ncbi:MAG: orotidine-5'-phosphate decarboxylase [Nitrospinaceae bacterium]
MHPINEPKDRLIFALDMPSGEKALALVDRLKESVGCFKVGLELFIKEGPEIIKRIKEKTGAGIFLDLKLHDIPATVRLAVAAAGRHPIRFLTVHCEGGPDMLHAAVEGAVGCPVQLLGVTVLTSMSVESVSAPAGESQHQALGTLVDSRVRMAREAGLHGVVASGLETARAKNIMGPGQVVVPGIRPEWALVEGDDQSRVTTPAQAIKDGADLIVVGRPIRDAADPEAAARRIVEEIKGALADREVI